VVSLVLLEKEKVEYPPRSPDLTPLECFLWGALKNAVYTSTPHILQDQRHEIGIACATVPLAAV
jgi:hypothetical protein